MDCNVIETVCNCFGLDLLAEQKYSEDKFDIFLRFYKVSLTLRNEPKIVFFPTIYHIIGVLVTLGK